MSYILDALRKSDQQRQRGATPTLLTAQIAPEEPRQSENWIYGLIAAVLLGAGIVIGWLQPWQAEPPAATGRAGKPIEGAYTAREVVAAKSLESGPPQALPAIPPPVAPAPASPAVGRSPAPEPSMQKPAAQPASTGAGISQGRPAAAASSADAVGAAPKSGVAGNRDAPTPASQKSVGAAPADPAQDARVMTMGELPPSILQELPAMQISLHLHSTKPANRFVSINNQMLQEGAFPAPGLKLEQITPDGMVFSYKGYRFRRGVQ